MLISTGTAAGILQDAFRNPDGTTTNITSTKIHTLTNAGLFTNHGTGNRITLDMSEVMRVAQTTTFVADPAVIDDLILRVSVLPWHENEVFNQEGELIRTWAGINYADDVAEEDFLGGFESAWAVSEENAEFLADNQGILLATCKGFVSPHSVRTIVDYETVADSTRRRFFTEPAPAEVLEVIGEGIWFDVPGGGESGILVDNV